MKVVASAPMSTEEFRQRLCGADRNQGPLLLWEAVEEGEIGADTVSSVIGDVWSGAEFPDDPQNGHLSHDEWLYLFGLAGFTVAGEPAERPKHGLRLYRGAICDRRRLWSWTLDVGVAEKFTRLHNRQWTYEGRPVPHAIWTTWAPPQALLAINTEVNARDEKEVIVNTRGLRIVRWKGAGSRAAQRCSPSAASTVGEQPCAPISG